ncbi:MAG: MoaD/ThiS family protein [Deltaproteobacteria bacterium]|nr:MoaD/ThiS family protein [Deltaproteobacteria bacterium]
MQIVVSSNFELPGFPEEGGLQVQEGSTVGSLLTLLSQRSRLKIIEPGSGRVNTSDFAVILNGKEHPLWPQGLNTPLRDYDEIQILIMPLGGG